MIGLALLAFLMTLVVSGYGVKFWRRMSPAFSGWEALPRVAYRAELDRLAEARLRRDDGESREAFAERIVEASPTFGALTQVNVASAFGRGEHAPPIGEMRRLARAVRREVAHAVPWHHRLLGWINPFSWLGAR